MRTISNPIREKYSYTKDIIHQTKPSTKNHMKTTLLLILAVTVLSLGWLLTSRSSTIAAEAANTTLGEKIDPAKLQQATFAAGCFWGVEETFRRVNGVVATEVGYTGGITDFPTYEQVCTNTTNHAESVLVTFDPTIISYAELLDVFWSCHDPTTVDRQGPDVGKQYRSVIFYHNAEQQQIAEASLKEVDDSHIFGDKIVTEIIPAPKFYPAEDYHQQYFEKEGSAETCHVGIAVVHTKLAAAAAQARLAAAATQPANPTTQP
jgi:peptide-methionine (S)-S-oxide reductase